VSAKIVMLTVAVSATTYVVSSTLLLLQHRSALRSSAERQALVVANSVADYVSAAVVFDDSEGARELLGALRHQPNVACAALRTSGGRLLAQFPTESADGCTALLSGPSPWVSFDSAELLDARVAVRHDGKEVGTLVLRSRAPFVHNELRAGVLRVGWLLLTVIALTTLVSLRLQRLITAPLQRLMRAMHRIGAEGHTAEHVVHLANDEIGQLYRSFNAMLEQLGRQRSALDSAHARLKALLGALPDLVFLLDDQGRFVEVLAAPEELLYVPPQVLVGKTLAQALPSEVAELAMAALRRAVSRGELTRFEYTVNVPAGERSFEAVVRRVDVRLEGKEMALVVARDVTERNALQSTLQQTQKLDAVGQLAGGVAHDFNNLLAAILGNAELLELQCPAAAKADLQGIIAAAEQAADLTSQLLAFSRRKSSQQRAFDCAALIDRVAKLLSRTVDRKVTVNTELLSGCVVLGDESQLESALLNLALNARDAMPEGGTLTLAMRRHVAAARPRVEGARVVLAVPSPEDPETPAPGELLEILVRDTGAGIPAGLQARIFEPFFTTKPVGKGTGLGLAAVFGVVSAHHGGLELLSRPGEGTTFSVLLPLVDATAVPEATSPKPQHGTGKILLLDDDEQVLVTGKRMLSSLGYAVVPFSQPQLAVEYFEQAHEEISLAIVDMIMPVMNGGEVIARLRAIAPSVPILVASGYATEGIEGHPPDGYLQKPYRRSDLAAAVGELARKHVPAPVSG